MSIHDDKTTNSQAESSAHATMSAEDIVSQCKEYTMYSWSAGDNVDPIPFVSAKGVYLWDAHQKRYLDFNSQSMSVLIGHGHPRVVEAITEQLQKLPYSYPGSATEPRARLGKLLASLFPTGLQTFFFTLGGAEANENAVRAARAFTGRQKVLSRYRSYHGASALALQLTGDVRRVHNEPGPPGVIRVLDPAPYHYSFGTTPQEQADANLAYLEEVIMYEGPHTIAAMIVETVTGTNGVLAPPADYLAKLHTLLKKHGILLICDEVMSGFGRTGKMFAFEHYGVTPDIVTMAKGLTSSYLPLGAMAVKDEIAQFFKKNVFWGGHTYNSHATCLAAAQANIEVLLDEKLVENAAALEPVMKEEMAKLSSRHPSVLATRALGLFGMIDVRKNNQNEPIAPYGGAHPAMAKLAKFLREKGLFTLVRWHTIPVIPPLCITEAQLREGFAILDEALQITDAVFAENTAQK